MFRSLIKKRIREDSLANIFTNSIIKTVEEGFQDVVGLINEAPEFESSPRISDKDSSKFMLIVISGNLKILSTHFSSHQEMRLLNLIMDKFSNIFQLSKHDFNAVIKEYQDFQAKVNHPSKNILYGMSKTVFYKYKLNQHQEPYFKNLNAPNPLFLKRLDEIMASFLWDWDHMKDHYYLIFK